ncbi:tRNA epoxyqueuosine(34) reductase QueG [Clostridium sp. B9]|uniref:tRNA epoxyqueuosine(34) reductase QueG n=1 Tax=Clostridium sp. B9 TaxID=3423224 RepID=UPI003D2EC837
MKKKIIDYCNELGLENIGFVSCRKFSELEDVFKLRKEKGLENDFEESDIEKRINPNIYMEDGKTIITIAFPYLHNQEYIDNGFSVYTRGQDYHAVVNSYLKKIGDFIETLGGKAISLVDSNALPERYIAYLGGIGFIGKNNMLITEKYGSYVFLGEIITNLDIECEDGRTLEELREYKKCGDCEICFKECPTKVLNRRMMKNTNSCMSYITQKKEIEDKYLRLMNGRIFGCDSCQKKCPYNKEIEYSNIKEFTPFDFMEKKDFENLYTMSKKEFNESIKQTSCGWRGKNVILRNVIIRDALFDKKDISKYKVNSENLRVFKNRLLNFYDV